jgi:hypothetical protein
VIAVPSPTGCAAAIAYLSSHAAPGFTFVCPGNAEGRQALTCVGNDTGAGPCAPHQNLIVIADLACPAPYENEAHNSWVLTGMVQAPLDPYGHC